MFKSFSKSFLNNLLSKIDIIELLSSFIKIEKKNGKFLAICPFHKEKTPSFFISESKKVYYCFGCHSSGNIINFLMKYKNISFIESVNTLLKNNDVKHEPKKDSITDLILNINKKMSLYYYDNLKKSYTSQGVVYVFFLKRKIKIEIIKRFNLGFIGNLWHFTLQKLGTSDDIKNIIFKAGLSTFKNGVMYDRFRCRVIFPIKNIHGEVIGFGARALDDVQKPKYLNSPETIVFSKKKELYGLYEAICLNKDKCNSIIVVEGYFDVIMLHNHNITNVVAVLGTVFNKYHFKKLAKLYNKIIFCFDSDNAGNMAAIKTAYALLSYLDLNIFVGFVSMPKGYDPDSYVRCYGNEKFKLMINNSVYILDYIYNNIISNLDTKMLYDKIFITKKLSNITKHILNPLSKKIVLNHFIDKIKFLNECLKKKTYIKKNDEVLSLYTKACIFLLKKRNLIYNVNIDKLTDNKNIEFNSELNVLLEFVILLNNNNNISLNEIKTRMLGKINFNNTFSFVLDKMSDDIIKNEFILLMNKIYDINSL